MIPNPEATVLRQSTVAFIQADLSRVTLVPRVKVSNGSGGFVYDDLAPRAPADGRVIPLTAKATERLNLEGHTVPVEFILLMAYDAQVEKGDRFYARGRSFEVVHVQEKRDYQTKAELSTIG